MGFPTYNITVPTEASAETAITGDIRVSKVKITEIRTRRNICLRYRWHPGFATTKSGGDEEI